MKADVVVSGELTIVRIEGRLGPDAATVLAELEERVATREVLFVLPALGAIDSVGVALWARMVRRLQENHVLRFQEAPFAFLDYCNMIPAMLGEGQLLSFELPFSCESCWAEESALIERAQIAADGAPPQRICPKCGNAMTPDCNFDEYLAGVLA